MPSKVDSHFESYREQTRVKHDILSKYVKAYYAIRGRADHPNLVYIDAFAGCGEYQSTDGPRPGSPLRALATFSEQKPEVRSRITTVFVESNDEYYRDLVRSIEKYNPTLHHLRPPTILHGTFEQCVEAILRELEEKGQRMAPSFLFADPCGVTGLTFQTLVRFLRDGNGEAFLFFNYDAVNRTAGLAHNPGGALSALLGSDEAALSLRTSLRDLPAEQKETHIMGAYQRQLDASIPGIYSAAFRIEHEIRRVTSHYFIHLTRNDLGFRIMKEVMWHHGRTADGHGGLELEQASMAVSQLLIPLRWEEVKDEVMRELIANGGRASAKYFYETLSGQRNNVLCKPAYKAALLELEQQRRIIVFGKSGEQTTASTRRKYNKMPTLGDDCTIQVIGK